MEATTDKTSLAEKAKRVLTDYRTLFGLWLLLGVISGLCKQHAHNNYNIFRYVFFNTMNGSTLYGESTDGGYWDMNHYGPFFSAIIAPFAMMPEIPGLVLWCAALSMFMYWTVRKSSFTDYQKIFILWFCAHELLTALFMQQFNIAIAGIMLLSYHFVKKEQDQWATFFIVIGFLVKLYGIVGLAFFLFSKHKVRYVLSFVGWLVVLSCIPMLYSGVEYQISQYKEWIECLGSKNVENGDSIAQNISLLGLVHRISGLQFSDLFIILPGMTFFAIPYLRIKQYANEGFKQTILASALMFICLFSTGTESSGYIIALTGVAIWFTASPWKRGRIDVALMVFAFILTSLSPSDLFPAYIRKEWVQPYALKALPVAIIWFKLCYEIMTKDYKDTKE